MRDHGPELETIWDEAKGHVADGELDKAVAIYRYILIRYGEDRVATALAHASLGDLYLTMRKLTQAARHLRQAVRISPGNPKYRYLLGFVYSVQAKWPQAVDELQEASDAEPGNVEYLRGLGWALFNHGDRITGRLYLEEALGRAPDDVNILTDLSTTHLIDLDLVKAREYGDRALRIDPGNNLATRLMGKIDEVREMLKPD
jgi:tetratricopeptide (TPR) repeat protein